MRNTTLTIALMIAVGLGSAGCLQRYSGLRAGAGNTVFLKSGSCYGGNLPCSNYKEMLCTVQESGNLKCKDLVPGYGMGVNPTY